ncbi:hypothetical protein CDAR_35571 [Caerostris darwini]|uniref:Uncharacterized protein n=1 Tax=Caerostris darwini TaxID=1538125 RepID=A0AAV4SJ18_9ARAC|nr:hypothetical protein CDAR_35571 [Caerostris darwini]
MAKHSEGERKCGKQRDLLFAWSAVCFTFGDLFRKSGGSLFQNKQAPFFFVGKSEGLYVITGHDIALRRRHPPLPALRPHIIGIDSSLSLTAHPRAQLQF